MSTIDPALRQRTGYDKRAYVACAWYVLATRAACKKRPISPLPIPHRFQFALRVCPRRPHSDSNSHCVFGPPGGGSWLKPRGRVKCGEAAARGIRRWRVGSIKAAPFNIRFQLLVSRCSTPPMNALAADPADRPIKPSS